MLSFCPAASPIAVSPPAAALQNRRIFNPDVIVAVSDVSVIRICVRSFVACATIFLFGVSARCWQGGMVRRRTIAPQNLMGELERCLQMWWRRYFWCPQFQVQSSTLVRYAHELIGCSACGLEVSNPCQRVKRPDKQIQILHSQLDQEIRSSPYISSLSGSFLTRSWVCVENTRGWNVTKNFETFPPCWTL
jgi:hypothetical protein